MFLQYAHASIAALHQGVGLVTQSLAAKALTITVGALPTVSARVLPNAVKLFTAAVPSSRVKIVTGPNEFLMSQLRQGACDLVIGRMGEPDIMKGLSFEHLYSEKVAFVVRRGHPLLAIEALDAGAIVDYPLLMPPEGAVIPRRLCAFSFRMALGPCGIRWKRCQPRLGALSRADRMPSGSFPKASWPRISRPSNSRFFPLTCRRHLGLSVLQNAPMIACRPRPKFSSVRYGRPSAKTCRPHDRDRGDGISAMARPPSGPVSESRMGERACGFPADNVLNYWNL